MNHYICVFHTVDDISTEIKDLGDDPFFSSEYATWGICRPQVRAKWTKVGTQITFIGYHKKSGEYYLKGFFKAGEKINLIEALKRYPTNQNVIISKKEDREENNNWRDKKKKELIKNKYGNQIPDYLKSIQYEDEIFFQNKTDGHEIDNWKCQRIFVCNFKQFCKCVENESCEKENSFEKQNSYVVASEWEDFGSYRIKWNDVCPNPKGLGSERLKTPKAQHNVLKITDNEIIELKENIKKRISEVG